MTRDLRALGHRVVGVDAALSLVAAARDEDSGGEYLVAHAAELPFAVPRRGKTAARGYDAAWRRLASTSNPCSAVVLGVWQRY